MDFKIHFVIYHVKKQQMLMPILVVQLEVQGGALDLHAGYNRLRVAGKDSENRI